MFLSEWREFPLAPYLAGKQKNLTTARVSMLLKSRASLTCFRGCFLLGRAKDLSAPRYSPVLSPNGTVPLFAVWRYLNTQFDVSWYRPIGRMGNHSPTRSGHTCVNVPYSQSSVIQQEFKRLSKSELSQCEVTLQVFMKISFFATTIAHKINTYSKDTQ